MDPSTTSPKSTWRATLVAPVLAAAFLAVGGAARLFAADADAAHWIWMAGLVLVGLPVVLRTVAGMLRGRFAADLVAMLAIIGAAALGQPLAGLVVVLMQTGGEALERFAEGRASSAVRELEAAAPRIAHRLDAAGDVVDIPVDDVRPGDRLLVRPGELVPVDVTVEDGRSHVDVSRITGEPVPVTADAGTPLLSGSANGEGPLTCRATAVAGESQYARIVDLVRSAQASRAPIHRLADRFAVGFTPFTLLVCAVTWAFTGDAVRVLAVLVVATPCPLILATPVAIIGGIGSAARRQIIFRTGAALEQLARVRVAVFDKTGTVTVGVPRVHRVVPADGSSAAELLRLAGAVEQGSGHLLARSLVEAARVTTPSLPVARSVVEAAGQGVEGMVENRNVRVGSRAYVLAGAPGDAARIGRLGLDDLGLKAFVAVDGRIAGIVEYADAIRPGLDDFFAALRRLGIHRVLLLSGDHELAARAVAARLGIREVRGDLLPGDKVDIVRDLVDAGEPVLMVGDGTNDAPALSAATVGIALAGHGGGITAEAADAVILVDDLSRVVDALRISRRTLRIALQSIGVGLGLSAVAMVFAAFGQIAPAFGALLQEGIDVAVILNALRSSRSITPLG